MLSNSTSPWKITIFFLTCFGPLSEQSKSEHNYKRILIPGVELIPELLPQFVKLNQFLTIWPSSIPITYD
jgi:hypothetical protein